MLRIRQITLLTLSLAGLLLAVLRLTIYAQLPPPEISIEATVLEVDVAQLNTVQLPQLDGVLLPPAARDPGGFMMVIPEMLGRSLAASPGAKILQNPKVSAKPGKTAEFRLSSRSLLPDSQTYGEIEFDVTPNVDAVSDLRLWVAVRLKIVTDNPAQPAFASRPVPHEVKLALGQSALLGGFVAPEEMSVLTEMKNVDKIPIFSSYVHAEGQERSGRELVILLKAELPRPPSAKKEPPHTAPASVNPIPTNPTSAPNVLPVPEGMRTRPATTTSTADAPPAEAGPKTAASPQTPAVPLGGFSVQVGAFANAKSADDIKTALQQQFPDVFIAPLLGDRVLYRVRVGHFANAANAQQVIQRLKAAGFDAMVVRRD
jgi:cell division protein FtsN